MLVVRLDLLAIWALFGLDGLFLGDILGYQLLDRVVPNPLPARAVFGQLLSHLSWNHPVEIVAACLEQLLDLLQTEGRILLEGGYGRLQGE